MCGCDLFNGSGAQPIAERCSTLLENGIKATQRICSFNMPGEERQWMVFSNVGRDFFFFLPRHIFSCLSLSILTWISYIAVQVFVGLLYPEGWINEDPRGSQLIFILLVSGSL